MPGSKRSGPGTKPSAFPNAALGGTDSHLALLDLHSTLEFLDLWESLQRVFETLVPHDTLVMSVNYMDWRQESSKWRLSSANSRCPHDEESDRLVIQDGRSFFQPFLEAHPGIRAYRHSQIISDQRKIAKDPFYRHYMQPHDWAYSAHLLYWKADSVETSFALRRRPEQGDFTNHEMESLEALHPHIDVAFQRIRIFEEERQRRRLLERFYHRRPGAVLYFGWDMELIYASQDALERCASLKLGRQAARSYNPRAVFEIPGPVRDACDALRQEWRAVVGSVLPASQRQPPLRQVSLPEIASEAIVLIRPEKRGTLTKPIFEVRIQPCLDPADDGEFKAHASGHALDFLTPGERELADLVCKGLANKEIGQRLSKTEGTIKVQLSGIFRKLRINSRTQLIAAIHQLPE
ncbi:MAG: hypothetical protein JWO82_1698 [Akkermansiaceae bacterium]|nr:hypothetical protein [Akkermansiaceae bacterium]